MSQGLVQKDIKEFTDENWLETLQVIEKLGGSAGFQKSITASRGNSQPYKRPQDFPNFTDASANLTTTSVFTYVNIDTADQHKGAGTGFGRGFGGEISAGVLGYTTWDELKSATNLFSLYSNETVVIYFKIGDNEVARFEGAGVGIPAEISEGHFEWF